MKKTITNIIPLRKGSKGLTGTIANANHHAQAILPIIPQLVAMAPTWGFAIWKQGANVHEFTARDDRRFTLRAFTRNGEYVGIRLSARLSRSNEFHLMDAETQDEINVLILMMAKLAEGIKGNKTPLLKIA